MRPQLRRERKGGDPNPALGLLVTPWRWQKASQAPTGGVGGWGETDTAPLRPRARDQEGCLKDLDGGRKAGRGTRGRAGSLCSVQRAPRSPFLSSPPRRLQNIKGSSWKPSTVTGRLSRQRMTFPTMNPERTWDLFSCEQLPPGLTLLPFSFLKVPLSASLHVYYNIAGGGGVGGRKRREH